MFHSSGLSLETFQKEYSFIELSPSFIVAVSLSVGASEHLDQLRFILLSGFRLH